MERYVPARLAAQGIEAMPVLATHALRVASLPPHHRDPFDRLIVAQALVEKLPLVSADTFLTAYGVTVVDASR